MPRTVEKKLSELGRIRIGDREPNSKGNGTHPHKLDVFRLTSPNSPLLHFAASLYGGDVHPWTGEGAPQDEHGRPTQFELYTTVNSLDVLIPTFSAVQVRFERWSAGGCQMRCTGEFITHSPLDESRVGLECQCPTDDQERGRLAATGKACARILRLNVILPDLPGMGSWRLETKGFYATAELMGTLDMLQMAGQEHQIIEAVLRLEQRQVKRPGKGEGKGTLKFVVPCLWPKFTPRQLLATAAQRGVLLMAPPAQLPAAESAAQATDELFGDGAGDIFRPPSPVNSLALEHAALLAIETLHLDHGRAAAWIARYWAKMCKRFKVESRHNLAMEIRESLLAEVRNYYAAQTTLGVNRETGTIEDHQDAADLPPETAQEAQAHSPTMSDTLEVSTGTPGGSLAPSEVIAWRRTIAAYAHDQRLPQSLREQCAATDLTTSDSAGFALADQVLQWLDSTDAIESKASSY